MVEVPRKRHAGFSPDAGAGRDWEGDEVAMAGGSAAATRTGAAYPRT
ncbi:hypothetical protein DF3PA_30079 [Candidatus Defluviicoccus seviourii]|uniref:Uncharacterized protein n=2 Tax=root TaxID=1 RepID=A0A564WEZ1_9PROT|nr:hypothetical protein DF3PB_790006 [uncultured Defluviicoccus sp.]VUX46851.1 hypothetical protein DF3PA_30079 [Candidatus Defluviicoccus seviourii]